jgi:hypothetical protein
LARPIQWILAVGISQLYWQLGFRLHRSLPQKHVLQNSAPSATNSDIFGTSDTDSESSWKDASNEHRRRSGGAVQLAASAKINNALISGPLDQAGGSFFADISGQAGPTVSSDTVLDFAYRSASNEPMASSRASELHLASSKIGSAQLYRGGGGTLPRRWRLLKSRGPRRSLNRLRLLQFPVLG